MKTTQSVVLKNGLGGTKLNIQRLVRRLVVMIA